MKYLNRRGITGKLWLLLSVISVVGLVNAITPNVALACVTTTTNTCTAGSPKSGSTKSSTKSSTSTTTKCSTYNYQNGLCPDCQGSNAGGVSCSAANSGSDVAANPNSNCSSSGCDLIQKYVNPIINLLSIIFGLIAVASLITGGIQYSASSGDPQRVTLAKRRITMTIVSVFAYLFMYAFLQFIIPGGLFNRSS